MNTLRDLLYVLGLAGNNQPSTYLDERLSLLRVLGDGETTITKGGRLARIVELRGKDYSGMESEVVRALYNGRKALFDALPSTIIPFVHSHRVRSVRKAEDEKYSNAMAQRVADKWAGNFRENFRTRHFLVFVTNIESVLDKIGVMAEGGGHEEIYRILDEFVEASLVRLKDYSPKVLRGDEVASYWAWLVNGQPCNQRLPEDGWLDGLLSGSGVDFPDRGRHMIYNGAKTRYSAMLFIKAPGNTTDPRFLDGIYRINREFSIWMNFSRLEKQAAINDVEDRRRNTVSFRSAGDVILMELDELEKRLQADEISSMRMRWCLELFGDTQDDLERGVREVVGVIENQGFRVVRERRNTEAQFWSRFPEFHARMPKGPPNPRVRGLTSENAAHFVTFGTSSEGLDACSWGKGPITYFKTPQGSEFGMTFHGSTAPKWPGHTLVIGGTNSGKTTLISFLLLLCTRYSNFRAFMFDRLHGLEVFTRMIGGTYLDLVEGLAVNPLALPDDAESRAFMFNWFQVLTNRNDEASAQKIEAAIRAAFELKGKDRTLANIKDAFGLPEPGSIRESLSRWIDGNLSGIFNAPQDSFDFTDSQFVGIDMTSMLDLPDILAPFALYLFHKMTVQARQEGGYAVFCDEIPRYLPNETMGANIDMMLQEIRKNDGVFIGAAQSMDAVLNSPSADKFLTNIETYLLYPEPRARREHYSSTGDGLRLNDQEFHWLTQSHRPREVLLKRKNGESTVLNVDLSSLDEYLNIFNSSSDAVARMNGLRKERHDWQEAYLRGA